MKNRLKSPLSIFVVWHPKFSRGREMADSLYSIFCRDIEEPLSRGLGIPVYYRSNFFEKYPIPVDTNLSNRIAIVLLIDQEFLINSDFREYTKYLSGLVNKNTRIFPIALCEEAHTISCGLSSLQFINAYKGELSCFEHYKLSMKIIKTELLHDCARLLMSFQPTSMDLDEHRFPSPVKLFLSHAKKDGLETSFKFKNFIDAKLKLDVFFDTVDIADGYDFEKQLVEGVLNSALVVFHTDEYSTREWCRNEVLIAKRNKCSIVVVHDIKRGEKRAFPYLGNTPTIAMNEDEEGSFYEIVNLTLYQVINNLFQKELLASFHNGFEVEGTEFIDITSPPELFNYIDIYRKKEESKNKLIVLYPEPPLGAEELRILNEIDKEIRFITPILLPTLK